MGAVALAFGAVGGHLRAPASHGRRDARLHRRPSLRQRHLAHRPGPAYPRQLLRTPSCGGRSARSRVRGWCARGSSASAPRCSFSSGWARRPVRRFDRPLVSFLAIWIATMFVVYQLQSPFMLAFAAVAAIAWVCWVPERVQPSVVSLGAAALMGCALLRHRRVAPRRPTDGPRVGAHRAGRARRLPRAAPDDGFPQQATTYRHVTWRSLVRDPSLAPCRRLLAAALGDAIAAEGARTPAAARSSPADLAVLATSIAIAVWLGLQAAGSRRRRGCGNTPRRWPSAFWR